MKKIITIIFAAIVALSSCASFAQFRKDVHISYEQITTDASFKQFLKASKVNQMEILNYLMSEANAKYLACETIEDLYDVKEHLELIKLYNNSARQKSVAITNAIRVLDNKITQTEAEYKKETVIEGSRTNYSNFGQELD